MAQLVAHSLWERGVVSSSLAAPTSFKKGLGMNSIRVLFSLLISFSLQAYCPLLNPYTSQAQSWIQTYFIDDQGSLLVPLNDLELLANLLYFSAQRSQSTLIAQEASHDILTLFWQSYQNIAQTRRNPSLPEPFKIDYDQIAYRFAQTIAAQKEHKRIGATYAHAAQTVLKEQSLHTQLALQAITALRKDARHCMAQEFLSVKERLGDAFNIAQTYLNRTHNDNEIDRSFGDFFIDLSLPFLLKSFLEWEQISITALQEVWHILHTLIHTEITVWNAIEESRSGFYDAHYQAIKALLNNYYPHRDYVIMFDENGLIPICAQQALLP